MLSLTDFPLDSHIAHVTFFGEQLCIQLRSWEDSLEAQMNEQCSHDASHPLTSHFVSHPEGLRGLPLFDVGLHFVGGHSDVALIIFHNYIL